MTEKARLQRDVLLTLLKQSSCVQADLDLLRWLIWFPLLSTIELGRVCARSPKTMAAWLKAAERKGLIEHLVLAESGVAPHYRYYVSDLGLYLFAALAKPPLSVPRLVSAYAIDRDDLFARLVRPDLLQVLAAIFTRLIAEGRTLGYILTSYQQPWVQTETVFGLRQTMRLDAALLIQHPAGSEHAWYVRIDSSERRLFHAQQERLQLGRVVHLRSALQLQGEQAPHLLIVSCASRLLAWADLLEQLCEERQTALLEGGITIVEKLNEGIYTAIWWPFAILLRWKNGGCVTPLPEMPVSLPALFGSPVSRSVAERFSQRATFAHLLTERASGPLRKTTQAFPRVIGLPSLQAEVLAIQKERLADVFAGNRADQRAAAAWLTIRLSGPQKDTLYWLAHQPLLSIAHLAMLLVPGNRTLQMVRRHLVDLQRLGLVRPLYWKKGATWPARERYLLSEAALIYVAQRAGLPAAFYLKPRQQPTHPDPLQIQKHVGWLFHLMEHTDGVYSCLCRIVQRACHDHARVILWKNEFESVQGYWHPLQQTYLQVRPDAELLYLPENATLPLQLWVEYDRGTTFAREQQNKYSDYDVYRVFSHKALPPILLVTTRPVQDRLLLQSIGPFRQRFCICVVQEKELSEHSLLSLLQRPD